MLPSLKDLLQDKTVFILGAGASKPYGFPLWEELKIGMLEQCNDASNASSSALWGLDYWRSALASETPKTVDTLAKEADDASRLGFQVLTSRILAECEFSDKRKRTEDWIELFAIQLQKVCVDGGAGDALSNLGFINFNYDRCFAYHFSPFVESLWKGFRGSWERDGAFPGYGVDFRQHIHPHGVLGGYPWRPESGMFCGVTSSTFSNFNNMPELGYGETSEIEKYVQMKSLGVMPVDVVGPETWHNRAQIAYIRAQRLLNGSKNVIFIGLSREGWEQCHLVLPDNISAFATGSEPLSNEINCLGYYALDLASALGRV